MQLRRQVKAATLRGMHHTSLYRRLILQAKATSAHNAQTGASIHTRLGTNPKEGTSLLKFVYGQLYNGKKAKRYGHAPTDECPLCRRPDSCIHIAGECKYHKYLAISRHNAACQLVHAAIRNSSKGGGALYSAEDLRLVAADAGSRCQTTTDDNAALITPPQEDMPAGPDSAKSETDWLQPIPPDAVTQPRNHTNPLDTGVAQHRRHTDISKDPRCDQETTT
jgi:predicted outer membrane repeat protein